MVLATRKYVGNNTQYKTLLNKNNFIKNGKKNIRRLNPNRNYISTKGKKFELHGLNFSGMSPDNNLPEIIELKNHPWFIGVQFHPEFKSRPLKPHPLFSSFIKAAKNR